MSVAPQALPYALPLAVASVASAFWLPLAVTVLLLFLLIGVLAFFRDPLRQPPGDAGDGAVLCPADGLVTKIDRLLESSVGEGELQRVVIFLNVFNVHVQRSPIAGRVVASERRRGRKLAAYREDVDELNESHLTVIENRTGLRVGIRQIAGLVARRIVPYLTAEDEIDRAGRLGVIQFGSRVDVTLSADHEICVQVGDKVRSVTTVLARPSGS